MLPEIECNGFLFVGDPHVTGRKPGRRKDKDFVATVLGKLKQATTIANEHGLCRITLGDMLDRPYEESERTKLRLNRTLKEAARASFDLLGNHEPSNEALSDDDTLSVLREMGGLNLIDNPGAVAVFIIDGRRVGLGATPYGLPIPDDVSDAFGEQAVDAVVWLTHHDLAFGGMYPGALPLKEIKGCNLVVNGHIHDTKPLETRGKTTWFNPGNITRMSVDMKDHVPSVWKFTPAGGIEQFELEHDKDAFDLTGRLVEATGIEQLGSAGATDDGSEEGAGEVFVELLKAESSVDLDRSMDGSILREEMDVLFKEQKVPGATKSLLLQLLSECTEPA